MNINISLNEVLRDFIGQLIYTYDKYINKIDLSTKDITDFNLLTHFYFENIDKLNSFMYVESPLEIFGHADQLEKGLINKLNIFLGDIEFEGDHTVTLVSREVSKSIPATLFFLSKTGCEANKLQFINKYEDEWSGADILITANPIALKNKPEDKISVKVNAPYNTEVKADYEIDTISQFFNDKDLREKILQKIIITNYEEIK